MARVNLRTLANRTGVSRDASETTRFYAEDFEEVKDAIDDGTAGVNTESLEIGGVAVILAGGYITPPAGTASAGTAPIKLTAGTNLTTPEDGALEFDGSALTVTIGGVRKTLNDQSASAGFDALTGGTNTTAAMVVGSGASLGVTGTGTITATSGDSATAFFSAGTIEHEYGGLEADVSAYAGLIAISGGATSNVTNLAGLNSAIGSSIADGAHTTSASDLSSGTLADARLSSNVPLKDAANTFTNGNVIDLAADAIGLRISGDVAQTADMFVVEASGGTDYFKVDANGDVFANQALTVANTFTASAGADVTGGSVMTGDDDEIQLKIKGNAAQTANIFEIEKSDGTDLLTVDGLGVTTLLNYLLAKGGSAADPGLAVGQANCGLYLPAANQIGLTANGAAVMTHDGSTMAVTGAISATSTITAPAATTSIASLNVPHGTAPSSPTNGDVWTTTAGVFARVNGSTVDLTSVAAPLTLTGTSDAVQLLVKGNATQTNDVFSVQNNASSDLFTVDNSGNIEATGNIYPNGQTSSYVAGVATQLRGYVNGGLNYYFETGKFYPSNSAAPAVLNEAATSTNPTLVPNRADDDTGIGWASADDLSVVAGGIEAQGWDEVFAHVLTRNETHAGITASTTQSQGQQPLYSSFNEVSTVANGNDVVTLPNAVAGAHCVIINNGANTLQIFPASSDNLGAGVNISTTLAAGGTVHYFAYDATNWASI